MPHRPTPWRLPLIAIAALTLTLGAAGVQAQGASQAAQGQGASQGASQGQGQGRSSAPGQSRQQQERTSEPRRESLRQARQRDDSRGYREVRRDSPSLEERVIRRIFEENRQHVSRADDLPPGIRQNLERGKPLPPGIAKRFDDRLYRQLPRYEGYEWRQAGPDAILVDIANEVIYEILHDVVY